MKRITIKRNRFNLKAFLHVLHKFSIAMGGDGDPMPIEHGDIVYFDTFDLSEALRVDMEDEEDEAHDDIDIPNDSLKRLEAGYRIYGMFGISDGGFSPLLCADKQKLDLASMDDEDEEDEENHDEDRPRRRRTKKYLEQCGNTPVDECRTYGYLIALQAGTITIEGTGVNDMSGECELEPVAEPNLVSEPMRKFARSFLIRKTGGRS
jgi:hypothetical protein